MENLRVLLSLAAVLFSAMFLAAEDHPNYSGTWKLNLAKSEMGSSGVTDLVVDVRHNDPVITSAVRGTAVGQRFEENQTVTTDGKPSQDSRGVTVKVSWDGPALVWVGTASDGSMVYLSRATLSADGKHLT